MKRRYLLVVLAVLGGLALVAAACAPAAESKPAAEAPKPATEAPKPVAEAPKPAAEAPKPVAEAPKPAAQQPVKPKASLSGVPLDPNAKFGGVIRLHTTGQGPSFSTWEERSGAETPWVQPVNNMLVTTQTWGTKEELAKASYFNVVPDLAQSWEQSADGLKWTFKVRSGVKWSDGIPFTCADAKWSLDSIRTGAGLKRSPAAVHFLAVKEIQCADDLTMVVTMKQPKPGILQVIAYPYHVMRPKHIYEKSMDLMRNEPPKVGAGPFALKEWLPGEKASFTRKSDYWDQPLPYLDGVEVLVMTNQAADTGLRAGRLDFTDRQGLAGPRLKTLRQECTGCVFYDSLINPSLSPAIMPHYQRPPWNDPLVKDALSYAFDRKKFAQLLFLGEYGLPTGGLFVPGGGWEMPYERVKQIPGYNIDDPEGNKKKARELLAQAGFKPNELKLTVTFWATIQDNVPPIIEDFRAVGINAEPLILETARAYEAWTQGAFDVGVHSFWYITADPDEMLYEHFYTGSDRNYNRYARPEVDRLIDQMSTTVDPELRKKRAWDVAETIMRDQAKILGGFVVYTPVHGPRVRGWAPGTGWLALSGPSVRFHHVWLAEK